MHELSRLARRLPRAAAACLALVSPVAAHAQQPGLGAALELVDPDHFRVCADPRNLPFSNEAGEGFENKIAALLADKLGRPVEYTFQPQIVGFYRNTLNAFRCDVVIGVVKNDGAVRTTEAYYRTAYALLFKPGHGLDGVASLADPRLQGRRLGVIARTPPSTVMVQNGLMALAKPYPLTVDTRVDAPGQEMVADSVADRIDAAVLWGPIAGYHAREQRKDGVELTMTPLPSEPGAPMEFRIAMGVRHSDDEWKQTLNKLLRENRAGILGILRDYGVPLLDEQGHMLPP